MNTKRSISLFAAAVCLIGCGALVSRADTHYVWRDNPTPVSPYTNGWASAATNIQLAVDAAGIGDTVLVTNGTYDTGGSATTAGGGLLTNRVCINDKDVIVRSVNGPEVTIIKGSPDPGTGTNGPGAVRCAYIRGLWDGVAHTAYLAGFTLTNGYTMTNGNDYADKSGGGVHIDRRAAISNCVVVGNTANYIGGGVYNNQGAIDNLVVFNNSAYHGGGIALRSSEPTCAAKINSCTVSNNHADYWGGGIYCSNADAAKSTPISNCVIIGNSANAGAGGAYYGYLYNCAIVGNSAADGDGGGTANSALYNCTVVSNNANSAVTGCGGGVFAGTATNCLVTGNTARYAGGAGSCSAMYNCLVTGNRATVRTGGGPAGGVYNCPLLYNCTIVSNSAATDGGGVHSSTMYNCISWDNTPAADYLVTPFYSCGIDYSGNNNISTDPLFVNSAAGNYRLSANSPCVNAGTNGSWTANSVDLDGRMRIRYGTVDMGAYETIYSGTIFSIH